MADLKDELRKLVDIQEIDKQIYALKRDLEVEKPSILHDLETSFQKKKETLISLEKEITKVQIEKKERELDLSAKEEEIKKSEAQLSQLKTNQEYQSKTKEIASLKSDVSVIEESVLQVMEKLDNLNSGMQEKRDVLRREEDKYLAEKRSIESEMEDSRAKLKMLLDKKEMLKRDVDTALFAKYDGLVDKRDGIAIVPLKNFSCNGCFMRLPTETFNQIKQYKNVVYCGMCARMLYLEEDFSA